MENINYINKYSKVEFENVKEKDRYTTFIINNKKTNCKVIINDITNGYNAKLYELEIAFYSDDNDSRLVILTENGDILYPVPGIENNVAEGLNKVRILTNNIDCLNNDKN